jgi:hypothetical protein
MSGDALPPIEGRGACALVTDGRLLVSTGVAGDLGCSGRGPPTRVPLIQDCALCGVGVGLHKIARLGAKDDRMSTLSMGWRQTWKLNAGARRDISSKLRLISLALGLERMGTWPSMVHLSPTFPTSRLLRSWSWIDAAGTSRSRVHHMTSRPACHSLITSAGNGSRHGPRARWR